jgi:hypothetical protein
MGQGTDGVSKTEKLGTIGHSLIHESHLATESMLVRIKNTWKVKKSFFKNFALLFLQV